MHTLYLTIICMITGYEFGNFLADWSKNQFKKSGSLDKKYNNVLTPGKVLLG